MTLPENPRHTEGGWVDNWGGGWVGSRGVAGTRGFQWGVGGAKQPVGQYKTGGYTSASIVVC